MKEETKHNIKQAFETLLIGIICSAFVISMNQSCSNTVKQSVDKKETATKKIQNIKSDTITHIQSLTRIR